MSLYKLASDHGKDSQDMRDGFCQAMLALARENPNVLLVDADLMSAMGTKPFAKEFPQRTINCGIQESNMIGVACGLSVQGKIPFAHTFAPFATRRACDQIFMSGAYNHANVKVVGSDPGITAAYNGGTHMPFEDMGIMRGIPTMTVIEPSDIVMLTDLIPKIAQHPGMVYMRLVRKEVNKVYAPGASFQIGKSALLKEGTDATVVASGCLVTEALSAGEKLQAKGISVRILDLFTWKPLDQEAILSAAQETGAIVTAENHNVVHGLGAAVAEYLVKHQPIPMEMVGIQDEFGEVGPQSYLRERFQLTDDAIVAAVERAVARKKG